MKTVRILVHTSLLITLGCSIARAQDYASEPPPRHREGFEQRKRENNGSEEFKDSYYDRYDRGNSDYESHVYGEDSDYFYLRPNGSPHPGTSAVKGQNQTISGSVETVKPVNLENPHGTREQHHLARLRLEDHTAMLVDLGPNRGISDFDLERGDIVQINGRKGTIEGRSILFANTLTVNGHRFQIQRGKNASRFVDFKGEVEDYHPRWVDDEFGNTHRVLKISNVRGESWLIDLPATVSWRDLQLRLGSDFEVRGTTKRLGNQKILSASSVRVDGEERLQW